MASSGRAASERITIGGVFSNQSVTESFLCFTANKIYTPSYVSLETALAHYGFITEGVFQITGCSTRKTEHFNTPVGYFTYRNLKPELFFGYRLDRRSNIHYLIAEPEKAIIDYLYLNHKIHDTRDLNELRWNFSVIAEQISLNKLNLYNNHIGSGVLNRRLQLLTQALYAITE